MGSAKDGEIAMRRTFDFPADTVVLEKIGEFVTDAGRSAGFSDA